MLNKQKIKDIQSLGQKKFRTAEKCFIAEGPKIVGELLADPNSGVKEVFGTAQWFEENGRVPDENKFFLTRDIELSRLSALSTPNKVLAVVSFFEEPTDFLLQGRITLILDGIQDPGNLGTIIRIADWFGIGQIVASPDSADLYNSKVVQATMGSIARVKVIYRNLKEWIAQPSMVRPSRSDHSFEIYAATLNGKDINETKRIDQGLIIIGNESKGIHEELLSLAHHQITISKKGKAESLNAAVATGIILSHLV